MMSELVAEIKTELFDRQSEIIRSQAEIIRLQSEAIDELFAVIAQHAGIEDAELASTIGKINEAAVKRAELDF